MCGQTALPLWILLESSFPLLHALGTESDLSLRLSVYLFRHYPPPIVCLQGLCRAYQYLSSHMAATAKHYYLQGFEYFGHCWKCHGKPTKHTIRQAIVSCLYLYSLLFFDDYYSEAFLWQLALCSSAILQICHERG